MLAFHLAYQRIAHLPGWYGIPEARCLWDHAIETGGRYLADVGTFCGRSALLLAQVAQVFGGTVYCVDMWSPDWSDDSCEMTAEQAFTVFQAALDEMGLRHRVVTLRSPSDTAAETVEDGLLDLAHIDADHSAEAVKKDLKAWMPKVRYGGRIVLHDYNDRCPVKAVATEILPTAGWRLVDMRGDIVAVWERRGDG